VANLRNKFKSFISNRDFADALKSVADDLKFAAATMFGLGLLSLVPKLPPVLLPIVAGLGLQAVQVSAWVTVLLFSVATVLYVVQFWLRVSQSQRCPPKSNMQNRQIESVQNGKPCGQSVPRARSNRPGRLAGPVASAWENFKSKFI